MAADGYICVVDGRVLAFAGCSSLSLPLSMFVFCVRYSQCSSPGKGMTGGSFKVKAAARHGMFVRQVHQL
jgi:F0F1-type ATP synthase assembly protein I